MTRTMAHHSRLTCRDLGASRPDPARLTPPRAEYATVRFLTAPHDGRMTAITRLPSVGPCVPAVHVRAGAGDIVRPATDNAARLGGLVVTGPGQATADDHAQGDGSGIRSMKLLLPG